MDAEGSARSKTLLVAAVAIVVGIALGFVAGRLSSPSPTASTDAVGGQAGAKAPASPLRAGGMTEDEGGAPRGGTLLSIRRAMDLSDPVMATGRFVDALEEMSASEAADIAKALWARPGNSLEMNERKRLLAFRWGQLEHSKAVEFAQAQSGQGKVTAISASLAGWASVDPGAAKAWIDGQVDPEIRVLYDIALVDGWARADLQAATSHVLGLEADRNAERMLRVIAGEHVRQDPRASGPWALGIPQPELRAAAIDEVATRWVWADPAPAIDWVGGIASEAELGAAMRTAMAIWTRANPQNASDYLNEMPTGLAKDHAVSALSEALAPEDPAASAVWAATVTNPALRESALQKVASAWLHSDREAAVAWLPESGLSEQTQRELAEQ
jgi:hypothetical protein